MKDLQRPVQTWKSGGICPFGQSGVGTEDATDEMYMPIFEASHGRFGWISGRLDPRLFAEMGQRVQEAKELSALCPSIMITVPSGMQGIEVVNILTSRGIRANTDR